MGYIQFVARHVENVESHRVKPVRSHVVAYRQCKCRNPAHRQFRNFDNQMIEILTLSPCFYTVPRTLIPIPIPKS